MNMYMRNNLQKTIFNIMDHTYKSNFVLFFIGRLCKSNLHMKN